MSYSYLDYFSEAYNDSALQSGVSPQTGVFQATLTLASISSGVQNPVGFSLRLMIGIQSAAKSRAESAMRKADATSDTASLNACLNIPYIDTDRLKIFFSSGESEELKLSGNTYSMVYHRLMDVQINRVLIAGSLPETYWYKVSYKGGSIEYYNHNGHILKSASAAGHVLEFKYESDGRCTEISSEGSGKIIISYDENNAFTVTKQNPGMSDLVTKVYTIRKYRGSNTEQAQKLYPEDCVESVGLPNDNDHRYRFEYRVPVDNLPEALYSITTPFGTKQVAKYTAVPYGEADGRKENFVAVVSRLETSNNIPEGEQSEALTQLSYTDYDYVSGNPANSSKNNFTGYESLSSYRPISGVDNCIRKSSDYTYSVIERINVPGVTVEQVCRTYNRFHLLINEVVTQDSETYYKTTRSYVYPVLSNKDIDGQPSKFSLWTSCTTNFQLVRGGQEVLNASRDEVESRQFDDYGNLVSSTSTSGIVITNVYYSANPAADSPPIVGCPAAPYGIPCYLRSNITSPNQLATIKPEPKVQQFTYASITGNPYVVTVDIDPVQPSVDFRITPSMVLLSTTTINDQLMGTYEYKSNPESGVDKLLTGVLIKESSTSGGREDHTDITWKLSNENTKLDRETVYNTALVNNVGSRETRPGGGTITWLGTGQIDTAIAANFSQTKFEYNDKGELKKRTSFYNSVYEVVEDFEFLLWSKVDGESYYGYKNILKCRKNNLATDYGLDRDMQVVLIINPEVTAPNCLTWSRYRSDGSLFAQTVFDRTIVNETKQAISNVTTNTIGPMVSSSLGADGSAPWKSINPVDNIVTNSMGQSSIRYFSEVNQYGLVSRDGYTEVVTYPSGKEEEQRIVLNKNDYDGFGRLVTAADVLMKSNASGPDTEQSRNKTTFEYDKFDRVLSEKSYITSENSEGELSDNLIQTITYSYSQHIPSMYLPIEVNCSSEPLPGSSQSTRSIMLGKRTYDGFARLVSQETPGDPPSTKIKELYSYAFTKDDQPSRVEKNRGSIQYQYNSTTGWLNSMALNNDTSPAQPASTKSEFEYDNTTKLLKKETLKIIGDDSLLNQYDYTYDTNEQVTLVECYIPAISGGIYTSSYVYTKLQGAVQSLDIGAKANAAAQPQSLWRVEYEYNKIGQLKSVNFIPDNDVARIITMTVYYDTRSDGYNRGDVQAIDLRATNSDPEQAWLEVAVDFTGNNMGMEKERHYSDVAVTPIETLQIEQGFHKNLNLAWRGITSAQKTNYGYLGMGEGTPLSSSFIFNSSGSAIQNLIYTFDGLSRFSKIESLTDQKTETYTYLNDRVTAFRDKDGALQAYTYDGNGNVLTDNQQCTLRYNALNGLGSFDKNTARGIERTEYFYTPDGKLCQTLDKTSNMSIYYLYDGESVAGELEVIDGRVTARAFFVRVGDDILGRYITILATEGSPVQYYFDWYITDSSGSVIGVRRYTPGIKAAPQVHYYEYSDYGVRSDWAGPEISAG
ncbi:hypothetical protein [Pseudomonas moorei]|uniref:hypothetical protein n=1 Tax=Pseudomonas moorei TaxID=395599 RepID=UPI00200C737F|nr:hypothetical protein [Pseudomonas moorei]